MRHIVTLEDEAVDITEARMLLIVADGLAVKCPNCTAMWNRTHITDRADIYHPVAPDASTPEEAYEQAGLVEDKIVEIATAAIH